MTIKVKLRGDKAIVRFSNPGEENFFAASMVSMRDSLTPHPKISVRNKDGELLRIPKPPQSMSKPIVVPKPKLETIIENGTLVTKNSGPTPPIITKKPLVH